MEKTITKNEPATAAGYTYRRLFDIDAGLPEKKKLFVKAADGKYDLCTFVQRWVDYNVEKECGADMDLENAKAVHEQVKIQKTQLEVAKMRGELVDVDQVRRLWATVAATVQQNLLRLPQKIGQQVFGLKSIETVCGIIDREIRGAMEAIADTPVPGQTGREDEEEKIDDEE